jgi:oligopeptidase B
MIEERKTLYGIISITILVLLICTSACSTFYKSGRTEVFKNQKYIIPPKAKKIAKIDSLHSDLRVDNYYWLRERSNPDVIAYLNAENAYTDAIMKPTEDFQERIYSELLERIKETDLSVPYRIDSFYYYSRTEVGKQYPIYCRKKGDLESEEEILLDQNTLAKNHTYFEIGVYRISPNHRFLAYSVDTTGSEIYTLFIKDLLADTLLQEKIPNTGYSVAWARDNTTIFYTILDESGRPFKLYRHTIGSQYRDDPLVYQEDDDAFFLYIDLSKNREYLIIEMWSHTSTEIHYLDSENPEGEFSLLYPRKPEIEYSIEPFEDVFFILTNEGAKNFKLVSVSSDNPCKESWREVISHRDSVKLEGIDVFSQHLVVYEREKGIQNIHIKNQKTDVSHYIDFPEPVYTLWRSRNPDYNSLILRFEYTSLITPRTVFDYNMDTKEKVLKKQYEVLGDFNPSQYTSERIMARAEDGTKIPISLVYKKGIIRNGKNPLILYGYGAYGDSYDPYFSSSRLSILNRGFIYAIAHVRGGGEMGKYWYEQGKLLNKKNTFNDYLACAEYLIEQRYTSKEDLVISGGSAGGLLIGTVLNMRPDLFKAAIADVPFVDVLNTMLDPSLPLTVLEYDEWGNPNEKEFYEYIKSYSPYDNVEHKNYPHILITASLNDTRVMYWEAAKWTAKLRELKTDNNILLLKMEMGAGHMGASGRYDYLRLIAFEYAYLFTLFGIKE